MKHLQFLFLSIPFVLISMSGLFAESNSKVTPCSKDMEKFCDHRKSEGRLSQMQCLMEKESDLSSTCSDWLKLKKEEIRKSSEECFEDRNKFCKFVIPGGGRILRCLMNHESSLSNSCKEMIQKHLP
ncbi:hypothetical protein LEP1GSC021_0612 [Leptospira noguchii str. 1993005606]|uniref:Cysteine rich repeat domain protein n=2 Tax=Leptospira noguchii TaxID=28182 RepID=M6YKR2_9LEPT|nr:hypothetical protein [Leptospira noguchii]EMM99401.1 hypothetical protein LEP1GSC035_1204 [Leptospira noguchii str. 2007001578]EMO86923.1 hypothetical protein LEP1GSC024_3611 [Leptospira noguchii str. 2001034031]EPE82386.1 hypothetical protein LEP1GSC021_0612 [Leptospira noguchii str. 1993005606]